MTPIDSLILTDPRSGNGVAGLTGRKVVLPANPDLFLLMAGDGARRARDLRAFFDATTPAEKRVRILDRWDEALTACVRSGQGGSGDVRVDLDAAELASLLIEAWEGAALRGKVTRSRLPYDRFEAVTVPALLR